MKPVVEDLHNSDANEQPVQFPGSDLQFFEDDDHDVMVDSTETNVTRKADQPGSRQSTRPLNRALLLMEGQIQKKLHQVTRDF